MRFVFWGLIIGHLCIPSISCAASPLIIAHRGASGYLPEHTLAAKALAYGMGADFIEQDVVLTADDIPIVVHDIHLDTVTDVARVFPSRKRADDRYYAIDFRLAEIKQLRVTERIDIKTNKPVFPSRFPIWKSNFRIPTLAEEIELIQGLNKSTQGNVGIYPEIKAPSFHRAEGKDISKIVLKVLHEYGYETKADKVILQCFDAAELKRIRTILGAKQRLVQLISSRQWQPEKHQEELSNFAKYADGIGPPITLISDDSQVDLALEAHRLGLFVHPYTYRVDNIPVEFASFDQLLKQTLPRIDGVFTDFPDAVRRFIDQIERNR